jgi:acetyl-CoA acetyltransferase
VIGGMTDAAKTHAAKTHAVKTRAAIRKPYDDVVVCAPVTVPYRRYSTNSAQWWLARALHELIKCAGIRLADIDGLAVSSFTLAPDTAVGVTQHFGVSPRWLDHVPFGGASGIVALRRAARAVQAGDAEIVACIAGDTNHVDTFRKTLSNFSRFAQDAVYPYAAGGANASFALIAKNYMNLYGAKREDFGKICIAQRDNALSFPHALMKKKLTLDEYMTARPIADPIHLFDCVMPCAGAEGLLVCREDTARSLKLPFVRLLSTIERHNAFADDPIQIRGGWAADIADLWSMSGLTPAAIDFVETYDDYPVIVMLQFEDLGFCKKGEGPDFVRSHTFTNDGSFPHNTSGGQLSVGQAGAAGGLLGLVEAVRQLVGAPLGSAVAEARSCVVSGFGMINYDRGLSSGAAILASA